MKIREIKSQKFIFDIDSSSKTFRFSKLSASKNGSNFEFAK